MSRFLPPLELPSLSSRRRLSYRLSTLAVDRSYRLSTLAVDRSYSLSTLAVDRSYCLSTLAVDRSYRLSTLAADWAIYSPSTLAADRSYRLTALFWRSSYRLSTLAADRSYRLSTLVTDRSYCLSTLAVLVLQPQYYDQWITLSLPGLLRAQSFIYVPFSFSEHGNGRSVPVQTARNGTKTSPFFWPLLYYYSMVCMWSLAFFALRACANTFRLPDDFFNCRLLCRLNMIRGDTNYSKHFVQVSQLSSCLKSKWSLQTSCGHPTVATMWRSIIYGDSMYTFRTLQEFFEGNFKLEDEKLMYVASPQMRVRPLAWWNSGLEDVALCMHSSISHASAHLGRPCDSFN